jgi:hypothetical protein
MFNLNLNSLFCFSAQNDGYQQFKTPFTYEDGKQIILYVKKQDQYIYLTDLGETIKEKNVNFELIEKFCFFNSLEFDGKIFGRYINDTFENPSRAILDMIQSLIKISSNKDFFEQQKDYSLNYKHLNNYI